MRDKGEPRHCGRSDAISYKSDLKSGREIDLIFLFSIAVPIYKIIR